jgi:hypothetical protein
MIERGRAKNGDAAKPDLPMAFFRPIAVIAVCAACTAACGCLGWFEGTEQYIGYVLDKGDSEHIAKWTLAQTDGKKLWDGISALNYRVIQARGDRAKTDDAIFWCVFVAQRMEEWPPDRVFESNDGLNINVTTRQLVDHMFDEAASEAYNDPTSEVLLQRLRPDASHADWLPLWEEHVARLERSRRLYKTPGTTSSENATRPQDTDLQPR